MFKDFDIKSTIRDYEYTRHVPADYTYLKLYSDSAISSMIMKSYANTDND